jgi:hypothetical protein
MLLFYQRSILFILSYKNVKKLITAYVFGSVMQINYQDQDSEVQTMKKVPRNDKLCTLCEEFANQALDYLAENKTQTEIIELLHVACSQVGSLRGEVLTSSSCLDILDETTEY